MFKSIFVLFAGWLASGSLGLAQQDAAIETSKEPVARTRPDRIVTSVNQIVAPIGRQVDLPGMRPQALALSPNGKLLVTSGKTHELVIVSPEDGRILQHVPLPSEDARQLETNAVSSHILSPDEEGQVSFTGLIFSPDGSRIYLANVNGSIKVFSVGADLKVAGLSTFPLPQANAPRRKAEIPAGLAISKDGKRLYVALNLSNRLGELDAFTGEVLRTWNVGVAPYDVAVGDGKIYVSNWGGRRPEKDNLVGPAGHGTFVRVDPIRHIANEGSISIIDLKAAKSKDTEAVKTIMTGLHSCGMALSPNGRHLVVLNAGSDTVTVIDSRLERVVETICARQNPGDLFGANPNAVTFNDSGKKLFVCNGTQNAVAFFDFDPGKSKLTGLAPVGWFPAAIAYDAKRDAIYVANIKGIGPGRERSNGKREFASSQHYGSLTLFREPNRGELEKFTKAALANIRYPMLAKAALPPRADAKPMPVPERVGELSVFKHVVYLIKENRTYDQVLGDIKEGNGDPELCVFGETFTPNQHKMAREFVLLDNTYCSGIISSDGHEWATTAMATDYMEKSFAGFPRSYPDGMEDHDVDALAYSPAGFIWDNVVAHGKTLRDYGEFAITRSAWKDKSRRGSPSYLDYYHEFLNGTDTILLYSEPGVESLRPYLATNTVGWDMAVPDIFRAAQFIKDLKHFETNGDLPNLSIICLPNDHTSGTKGRSPTPAAYIADNDLAFGQIVEAISHSKFWKETCIIAIEDDPQAGWDHVSGYRTTAYVVSPYTKRGKVVNTQYNQTSILRTIELILGLPPMNQMDATATPMADCFTETPDFKPFEAVKNNIPLDQQNQAANEILDPVLRKYAKASMRLPLSKPDQCPEDLLNRILWTAMKGSKVPYPEWAVRTVDDD